MTLVTPNLELPYPEAADPPSGDEQMQALAEAIDGNAAPVAGTDIVFGSGYQADGVQGASYSLAWGRVWLSGAVQATSGSIVANSYLLTLPEAVWPLTPHGYAVSIGAGAVGYVVLGVDGRLQVLFNTSVWTPGNWVSLDGISYFLKTTDPAVQV